MKRVSVESSTLLSRAPASERDRYLVIQRVPDIMRVSTEADAWKTLKTGGRGVWSINLSALQRELWKRIQKMLDAGRDTR